MVAIPYSSGLVFLLLFQELACHGQKWRSNPLLIGSSISTKGYNVFGLSPFGVAIPYSSGLVFLLQ